MLDKMKTLGAVALVALLGTMGTSQTVQATSYLVVSGDTTMFSNTDAANDNAVFWSNLLDGGSNVLVQDGLSAFFNFEVPQVFTDIGASVTQLAGIGTLSAASFAGQDLFVSAIPTNAFSAAEATAISDFLDAGGNVLLAGEFSPSPLSPGNAPLNDLLSLLGSPIRLVMNAVDNPGTGFANVVGGSPLTSGVTTFSFGYAAEVTGGTGLMSTDVTSTTFVASQSFGELPIVPLPPSMSLLLVGLGGLVLTRRRRA